VVVVNPEQVRDPKNGIILLDLVLSSPGLNASFKLGVLSNLTHG
jgi:hypothetical protein